MSGPRVRRARPHAEVAVVARRKLLAHLLRRELGARHRVAEPIVLVVLPLRPADAPRRPPKPCAGSPRPAAQSPAVGTNGNSDEQVSRRTRPRHAFAHASERPPSSLQKDGAAAAVHLGPGRTHGGVVGGGRRTELGVHHVLLRHLVLVLDDVGAAHSVRDGPRDDARAELEALGCLVPRRRLPMPPGPAAAAPSETVQALAQRLGQCRRFGRDKPGATPRSLDGARAELRERRRTKSASVGGAPSARAGNEAERVRHAAAVAGREAHRGRQLLVERAAGASSVCPAVTRNDAATPQAPTATPPSYARSHRVLGRGQRRRRAWRRVALHRPT